jgi:hypothetical protein
MLSAQYDLAEPLPDRLQNLVKRLEDSNSTRANALTAANIRCSKAIDEICQPSKQTIAERNSRSNTVPGPTIGDRLDACPSAPGETLEFAQIAKDSLAAPALYRRIVGDVVRIDNRRGATGWASEFHGEPQLFLSKNLSRPTNPHE